MVKVMLVDLEKETVTPVVTHRAYLTDTVEDFLTNISNILEIPCNVVRCVREHYYNDLQLLTKRAATLKDAGFTKCSKVFIEYSGLEDDNQMIFQDTRLYSLLDRYENTIRLRISLPPYIQENNKKTSDVSTTKDNIMDTDMSHDIDEGIDETDQLSSESSLPSTATGIDDICGSSVSFPDDVCTNHSHPAGVSNHERAAPDGQENPADGSQVITGASTSSVQNSLSEEASKGVSADGTENWDLDDNVGSDWDGQVSGQHKECPRYFRAELQTNMDKTERTLIVEVDKRITLSSLKKELQQYVGTTADHFKVFRVYSNCQEVEVSRLSETLSTYNDDSKLIVKLGRALRKGEYRVKVYLLQINKEEVIKFLVEAILANGMTVLESKKVILKELKRECNMDVPLDRCRLRRKPWKNPTKIYQNDQVYGKDITLMANWEVFLEILDGPDPVTDSSMLSLYVRRWNPSTYTVDPLKEVILTVQTVDELRQELSSLSGIPVENIEFAKAKGTFPYEISLLEVHTEMDWNVSVSALNMYPLSICEDGAVIYYRDKTEKLMELSEAKKKELQQKENARLSQSSHCHYTPRKERALKIYTDDSTSQSANSISTSNRISSVQSVITSSSSSLNSHPELD